MCACGARAPHRVGWSRSMSFGWPLHQRNASLGAIPFSDVSATASNEQPACACAHTRSRHCALSLSRGGGACALAACARRAALDVVGSCPSEESCTTERHLPLGVRPCSDVRAKASNEQPACACAHTRSRHCALSLSLEEVQHARWRCASAAPRWLESVHALRQPTAPAKRPSPSVHGRALTSQPRPPTSSRLALVRTRDHATTLALFREEAQHATRGVGTPRRAGGNRPMLFRSPLRQRDRPFLQCTAVLRHASRCLQRAVDLRVCAHANAPLRYLSLGRRRNTRACGVRAPRCAGCSRPMPFGRTLHQREVSILRCSTVLPRASRGLERAAGLRVCAHAIAPLRSLSLGRRRSMRTRGVGAPRRAGGNRSMPFGCPLRQRDHLLPRCTAVLRHASCCLRRTAGLRVCSYAIAPFRSLSLWRRRSTCACGVRAPRRAGLSQCMPFRTPLRQRDRPVSRCTATL